MIIFYKQTDSTNRIAKELIKEGQASAGMVVHAGCQSAGRGQHGRTFNSPMGGLYFSLIEQPERVFSRGLLMDLVWQDSGESMERTVDTHIKTLRAKLRNIDDSVEVVHTHRGLGYSLRITSCD